MAASMLEVYAQAARERIHTGDGRDILRAAAPLAASGP